jgi:hypothetical protein
LRSVKTVSSEIFNKYEILDYEIEKVRPIKIIGAFRFLFILPPIHVCDLGDKIVRTTQIPVYSKIRKLNTVHNNTYDAYHCYNTSDINSLAYQRVISCLRWTGCARPLTDRQPFVVIYRRYLLIFKYFTNLKC